MKRIEQQWMGIDFSGEKVWSTEKHDVYRQQKSGADIVVFTLPCGKKKISASEAMLTKLGIAGDTQTRPNDLEEALADIKLHAEDAIFVSHPKMVSHEPDDVCCRLLTQDDTNVFNNFTQNISEEDLDNAYVELDHWEVYGAFVDGELVSASSVYPWQETTFLDLGVVTTPKYRGKGIGKALVSFIAKKVEPRGYCVQYRSQLDNHASLKLANSLDLVLLGYWSPLE